MCIIFGRYGDIESREFIVRISSFGVMDFPKLEYSLTNPLSSQGANIYRDRCDNLPRSPRKLRSDTCDEYTRDFCSQLPILDVCQKNWGICR